jgi:hypothetical protein
MLLDVSNIHSWYLRPIRDKGSKYVLVFLYGHWESLCTYTRAQTFHNLITHKGYLSYFYALGWMGTMHDLPLFRVGREVWFRLLSLLEFCLRDLTMCLHKCSDFEGHSPLKYKILIPVLKSLARGPNPTGQGHSLSLCVFDLHLKYFLFKIEIHFVTLL